MLWYAQTSGLRGVLMMWYTQISSLRGGMMKWFGPAGLFGVIFLLYVTLSLQMWCDKKPIACGHKSAIGF
jgi:hypothetical protein